jgi:putative FmdB family regulatory protein
MIYLYSCERCKEFEFEQKIIDLPLKECPKCKEEGVVSAPPKKLIGSTTFILRGPRWNRDSYSGK